MSASSAERGHPLAVSMVPLGRETDAVDVLPARSGATVVGREEERARLLEMACHPPSLAIVEGPAGTGKTRIVTDLAANLRRQSRRVLLGRCHLIDDPFPYGPFVEALRGLRGARSGELPPRFAAVCQLLPELSDRPAEGNRSEHPTPTRHHVFRGIADLLGSLGPTVCVLEDLQWADPASIDLLQYLVDAQPATLAIVGTCRDGRLGTSASIARLLHGSGPDAARIRLDGLDRRSVRQLAASVLGVRDVSSHLADVVHARTDGLPLAVREVVRFARDVGIVDASGAVSSWLDLEALGVPAAIGELVQCELEALGPVARQVVEAAAVLGEPATESLIAQVAGMRRTRVIAGLTEAIRAGFVVERSPDAYALRLGLAGPAIEAGLPRPLRRRLHLRAANSLEHHRPAPLGRLARHYREGGRPRLSLWRAEAGADLALAQGDPREAVRVLNGALSAPRLGVKIRVRLVAKLAAAALRCSDFGQAEALHELSTLLDGTSLAQPMRALLYTLQGNLLGWKGDPGGGSSALDQGIRMPVPHSSATVRAMADRSSAAHPTMSLAERIGWLDRATDAARRFDDPSLVTLVLGSRAHILLHAGDPAGWQAVAELPRDLADVGGGTHLVMTWLRLAWVCALLGHYSRARSFVEAIRRNVDATTPRILTACQSVDVVLRWAQGDWAGLESAAVALARDYTDAGVSVPAAQVAGLLMLARGAPHEAETTLRSCAERAARAGMNRSLAVSTAGIIRILLLRGEADEAWHAAGRALEALTSLGVWTTAAELVPGAVTAGLACGRRDEVAHLVHCFAQGVRHRDSPIARASLTLSRALVADASGSARARALFSLARRRFVTLPHPYDAARTLALLGQSMLRASDSAGATIVAEAISIFTALGATGDADEARRALRRLGVHAAAGGRRGRRSYGTALSPRERQVADLARAALTNEEIAQALHLSRRTVDGHIASILRKTAISRKRQLFTPIPVRST